MRQGELQGLRGDGNERQEVTGLESPGKKLGHYPNDLGGSQGSETGVRGCAGARPALETSRSQAGARERGYLGKQSDL